MDHGSLLAELFTLITSVPEFAAITGTQLGQNEPDPTLITLEPPACWVSFVGDNEVEADGNVIQTPKALYFMYVAFIYLPMARQSEMLAGAQHLPLLKKILQGVNGAQSANTGHRWSYKGQKLALVNTDRMVYAQRYSLVGVM